MLVVMRADASAADLERVSRVLAERGSHVRAIPGNGRRAVTADAHPSLAPEVAALPGVAEVRERTTHILASREWHDAATAIPLPGDLVIGGKGADLAVIAGPCAVESEAQLMRTAEAVAAAGARFLRGGAFKPRSSPYAFQGMGRDALALLARAREATGLLIVTEATDEASVDPVAGVADVIQIGSRNMINVPLLRRVARTGKPVLLKRGMAATIEELLLAAEYLLAEGNPNVMLCERGIRGFDPSTRNVMDLAAIPVLKGETHLPILADPSHATGRRDLVPAMAMAAVAAGADGLLIEVHPDPDRARSDGPQSLTLDGFTRLMAGLASVRAAASQA